MSHGHMRRRTRTRVQVGDRVRWREAYPAHFTESDRIGLVMAGEVWAVDRDGRRELVEVAVQWSGHDRPDMVPLWQLEVLSRGE